MPHFENKISSLKLKLKTGGVFGIPFNFIERKLKSLFYFSALVLIIENKIEKGIF